MKLNVNEKSFDVIKLLGHGKGGYSYLVTDGMRQYVIKQIHHEPCAYYSFGDKLQSELQDYARLREIGVPMPEMLDYDRRNERILKEYIDGKTAFELVQQDKMLPKYLNQVEQMCEKLYPKNTNIDYFPTNFILCDDKLWYIDYECNDYMEQWDFQHWGIRYWSKTPEFLEYCAQNSQK